MTVSTFFLTVREQLADLREVVALPEPLRAPLLGDRLRDLLLAIKVLDGAEKRSAVAALQEALAPVRKPKTSASTHTEVVRCDGGQTAGHS